ncbi:GNAT family N-acetyltransferase [Streptomyces sp. NPDC001812]|uniref:GNAT family N-acetyltransferase n=1 Tax=Streptomyces TaxID=1883 RepID=UPI00311AD32A
MTRADEPAGENTIRIPTDRLTLASITPAVASDLSSSGDGGYRWVGAAPADGTRVGAGLMVEQYGEGTFHPAWTMYVLVRREDDLAVGAMGFHRAPDGDGRVEIGYDLVEGARGHGYATEALRALSAWALAQDGVRTVTAVIDRANLPSRNVVTRAGFTRAAENAGENAGEYVYELRR